MTGVVAHPGVLVAERLQHQRKNALVRLRDLAERTQRQAARARVGILRFLDQRFDRVGALDVGKALESRFAHARIPVSQARQHGRQALGVAKIAENSQRRTTHLKQFGSRGLDR